MADLDTVDEFFGDESFDQDQDFAGDQAGQPADHLAEAKRRRIAKACDSCRRKKIRCNGENPCSNCSVYHTDCHFTDAPKKRATPRGAKYIQSLESRLAKMEMLLKQARPDIVLDDAGIDNAILATRPITTPIDTSRQGTLSPDFDEPPPPFQRQASQEQDEELVEEMGHLWQADDQADSQFNGPGAAVTPLVSVQRAVRDLMGDASFDESIKGFRARFTAQERQMATTLDGLSEVTERARVEQMLATLPPPTACKEYIDIYFSILQAEFTCINKEQFLASMNPQTWRPKRLSDLSALSTYLMVLAFGSHIKHEDLFVGDKSLDNEGFSLFTQARTFIMATRELNRLSFVQACVLVAIYLERIGQMQELWVLLGVAVRSAQSIGLHRKLINSATMDPVTIEVRKRCWWILYELDSRLTVMSGNPNAIHDSDCDQDLPTMSQEEIAESGGLTFKNGEPFSYGIASIKLARINHQIHRRLYSIHALHALTQEQTHKIVAEIDTELLEFAESLPDVYKPGEGREPPVSCAPVKKEGQTARESLCSFAQVTNNYLIPSLRLEYLQLVMLLHRRNMKPSNPNSPSPTSATRQGSSSPQSQQLDGSTTEFKLSERLSRACSSHAIAVQAARTILAELCYRVPMMSPSGVTLFARYSAAAALLLFSSLVRHPSSTSARSDLELLDLMRNVFVEHRTRHQSSDGKANSMPTHYGIMTKLMPDILATLAKVCAVAVSRTGTPRQKRAASEDVKFGQADYNQALFVPGAAMQVGETAFDAYSRSLYEMSTSRDGQMGLPQQVMHTASQMDYFDPTASGLLNFGWPAAFNPYEQPVIPASSGKPAGLGVHRPSLSMAAGIPALSPGFFFGMAASTGSSNDVLMQQQPGMAQTGSMMDGMDGSALVDDYDSQNFWNAFGMYQQ